MEGRELVDLAVLEQEARDYLLSHAWCPGIKELVPAYALPPYLALFLARLVRPIRSRGGVDTELWVVVGDLPPAYFITDDAETAPEALDTYCGLMEEWSDQVIAGGDLTHCYPVNAEPTLEHAQMLKSRVEFIRDKLIIQSGPQPAALNDP